MVIELPLAFFMIARQVKDGTFQPRVLELGTESRVVTLVLKPALESRVPAAAKARVDSLQSLMLAGAFSVRRLLDTARAPR